MKIRRHKCKEASHEETGIKFHHLFTFGTDVRTWSPKLELELRAYVHKRQVTMIQNPGKKGALPARKVPFNSECGVAYNLVK